MLGQILLREKLVDEAFLERAIAIGRNTKTRLGNVLISEGLSYQHLYTALAKNSGIPLVNLIKIPPTSSLLDAADIESYLRHLTLPYQQRGDRLVLATAEYGESTLAWATDRYGTNVEFVLTTPRDIRHTIQTHFSPTLTHQSVMNLYEQSPHLSAREHALPSVFVIFMILGLILFLLPYPLFISLLGLCQVMYAATMIFKTLLYITGTTRTPIRKPQHNLILRTCSESFQGASENPAFREPHRKCMLTTCEAEAQKSGVSSKPSKDYEQVLTGADLPTYTILIPMYKEKESLPHMLEAMQKMDYPASKLDIKIVLEEDDDEMLQRAYELRPHHHFDIIRVPPSMPRTKPKACNYALKFALGEYVTVYDADDRPDPQQLKKAVAAFRALPENIICLQARLNYYNANDNLLTQLFALEYSQLFHALLPGMNRLSMPLMLGGTSNHIALAKLRELGEWDPFNVTEDADLGTRLAARGYQTAMIDSDTMEEAPNTLHPWIKQRTRWIKGYMQTWLVHMRRPIALYRGLGWHGFIGFQCFVALGSFCYLSAPIAWLIALMWLAGDAPLPPWILIISWLNLLAYFGIHIAIALHARHAYPHTRHCILAALTYPFYLILHSAASYFAFWQLITKPHAWNKTTHGKARTYTPSAARAYSS